MTRIGIVGAGAAAAATTFALDRAIPSAEVTVLEKSGGVCGRAATRRRGDVTYDYGANYVKADDAGVAELLTETLDDEGLVDVRQPIYTFDATGTVSEGRDDDDPKWTYETGVTEVAKRLFGETGATVHRRTRVERLVRGDDAWTLVDADGEEWGPFDVLVLNPPAPQTAALLRDADWDGNVREQLVEAVSAVEYRTIWTVVLHYSFELDRPYYGLVNLDKEHDIGWISREECKRGHVPDGESVLVVQANHEWSIRHYDESPAENVLTLAESTAEVVGDERLTDPDWTDHQGWRYAQPETEVDSDPLRDAESSGLYFVGDWVAGTARVHAALRNGLDTGERLASGC